MNEPEKVFAAEIKETIPRYLSKPGENLVLMGNPNFEKARPLHLAFPASFEEWKQYNNLSRRRSVIYSLLDKELGHRLKLWQKIERYSCDRQAPVALTIASQEATDKDRDNPEYWTSYAKVNLILTQYDEAETHALKALTIDRQHTRGKIILADIFYATGRVEEGWKIYMRIHAERQGSELDTAEKMFGFEKGLVHSPFFAFGTLLQNDKRTDVTEESKTKKWDWALQEFNYSPHFRFQHAMRLLVRQKDYAGLEYLVVLTRIMPWFKDAVVSCYQIIRNSKLEELWKSDFLRLEVIMEENSWSPDPIE